MLGSVADHVIEVDYDKKNAILEEAILKCDCLQHALNLIDYEDWSFKVRKFKTFSFEVEKMHFNIEVSWEEYL